MTRLDLKAVSDPGLCVCVCSLGVHLNLELKERVQKWEGFAFMTPGLGTTGGGDVIIGVPQSVIPWCGPADHQRHCLSL